jgi:hypothetical protein
MVAAMTPSEIWQTAGAVLASLGGGATIVLAMSTWLGKVWANRILAKDRARYSKEIEGLKADLDRTARLFQGEIDKTLFVTKTHFETEFRSLRRIWKHVATVRSRMNRLREVPTANTLEEQVQLHIESFAVFMDEVNGLRMAIDDNSPFYSQELYMALDELLRLAQTERDDVRFYLVDRFEISWIQRGQKNFSSYLECAERVSALIRERLAKLSVRGLGAQ